MSDECPHGMLVADWCDWCKHPEKMVPHVSKCDDCGADVVWVRTEKGKPMSIDAKSGGDPDKARFRKERTIQLDHKIVGIVHWMRDAELEANTRPLYCCHFETCPKKRPKRSDRRFDPRSLRPTVPRTQTIDDPTERRFTNLEF